MESVNKLGIKVVLVTALVLLVVFGAYWGIKWLLTGDDTADEATASPTPQVLSEQDQDSDGLTDLVENLYKTDPINPDTDGDGVNDGQEVFEGRDPTVAEVAGAPRDIPLGDQVLAQDTQTQKYLAQLPEDLPREEVLSREHLEAFVNTSKGELLPVLPEGTIKTTPAAGKEAVKVYLDSVTPGINPTLHAISTADIEAAFRLHFVNNQSQSIDEIIQKLAQNAATLSSVQAPTEVIELHTKMVAATQALHNAVAGLKAMKEDFVGGLIAAKKIEDLSTTFQEIAAEVDGLDKKYGF